MPRTRLTEVPQRQSPRGPSNLRTSSSDSDPSHHRPRTERSPKLPEGRSPRGTQSDPAKPKKLGTRIADLESQLGQAQVELKNLKDQLSSAEAAKKAAQDQLEKKSKKQHKAPEPVEIEEKHSTPIETQTSDDVEKETDVFEVLVEKVTMETKSVEEDELRPKTVNLLDELGSKNDEINLLKTKLDEKDKQLEFFSQENENLKNEVNERSMKISSSQSEIEELKLNLSQANQELEKSKVDNMEINKKLEASEKAKEELENEMKRLRVQTEQWRKAADAAASVLAGGVDMSGGGRRISERCGSMDKQHYGNVFEHGGYGGYVGSPGLIDDSDDVFESGKRKGGSGIRMFGDLWKKKGQK
ncbi:hypothetical protein RD792_007197 [Penstemon davidsonii]|uniref:Interactor of constitutive active ROPs 4-like n=1 Tax=Penstemon davidsonii TaxID=160366 RepID=A0ABR0D5R1_9LAMI|nr:hypothetical protein RD792_007197 [Penstemon davidsonii]